MPRYGFGKNERLKSRRQIDLLFAEGKSYHAFPVHIAYRVFPSMGAGGESLPPLLVGVSAPKRHFKNAVDRNRIKRLLREAYRLQKPELLQEMKEKGLAGHVFFLFTGKELPDYPTIETAVGKCLRQLHRKVHETTT